MKKIQNVYLCRHGQTSWSKSGQHTSYTDLSLIEEGVKQAHSLRTNIIKKSFSHVFCSPLKRAKETAKICGLLDCATITDSLLEWNYGKYEGLLTKEIQKIEPHWNIFTHGAKNGESPKDVEKRVDAFIEQITSLDGDICLFSSGHISRAIISRWIGLPIESGKLFALSTASLSILGYEHEYRVIKLLNQTTNHGR